MEFYIPCSESARKVPISIFDDGVNINICVNGHIVAWFEGKTDSFVYNKKWLNAEGLKALESNLDLRTQRT